MKSIAHILILLLISFSTTANANDGLVFVGEKSEAASYSIIKDDLISDDNDPVVTTEIKQNPLLTILAVGSLSFIFPVANRLFESVSIRAPPIS